VYQHVSACISMYQHVSACISMYQHVSARLPLKIDSGNVYENLSRKSKFG